VVILVRLLMRQHGDPTLATILARLRCQPCKGTPTPVFSMRAVVNILWWDAAELAIELVPRQQFSMRLSRARGSGGESEMQHVS
jgi:hypothetical protein